MAHLSSWRKVATVAALAAVYYAAGKFGLGLASINPSASAVWPPTGIALAASLIFGTRVWPGIWIAALLVNLSTAGNVATSIAIATGNTLEAVVGAALVRRFSSGAATFERGSDIFRYAALAGLAASTLSATIGVTALAFGGFQSWNDFGATWLTWWLGDVGGALVVAPFLILWMRPSRPAWSRLRVLELAALLVTLVLTVLLVFGIAAPRLQGYPLKSLVAPVLVWAAFRFTQREVAAVMLVITAFAVWSTLRVPAVPSELNQSLIVLQAFVATFSITFLAVAASVARRRRTEASLRLLTEALEQRVIDRTDRLQAARIELRSRAGEVARTQEELSISESRLREAQELGRIGSWEWEIDRDVVWWSDMLYALYGLDSKDFGASYGAYLERVHPEDRDRVREMVAEALRDHQPFTSRHRIVRPDGSIVVLHTRGRVITDAKGTPVRMIGTCQDVTDRQHSEEARAQLQHERAARREMEEESQLKDEFLATLSHELRNPLHAILIWVRLLREGRLDRPARRRAVEAIRQSAELQKRLIYDLLDLARIASGQLSLEHRPVDVDAAIRRVIETMEPMARAGGIRLDAEVGCENCRIMGDADRLQQVMWNLLLNAIHFTPEGGTVRLTLACDATHARVEVVDDGPGIDPELAPHIFDRFKRGKNAAPRSDGLGLGLAVVKHLTQLHGGTVAAGNRRPGPGAIFTVMLPLAAAHNEMEAASGRSADEGAARGEAPPRLRGLRVLVVEDDADAREGVALLLTSAGAHVATARSCEEAVGAFERMPPDLLICDIGLPDGDGYQLLSRLRLLQSWRGEAIPSIALTGFARPEDSRRAIQAGYRAHLAKSLEPREFLAAVEDLLRRPVAPTRENGVTARNGL